MEASTLSHANARTGILGRRSPLLKLQGDERLVAMIRAGNEHAFEVLFDRYHSRLLAFCRHMLRSTEDAEDVLQEVFVKAHAAMIADERPINVRPWLYRISRNRCLNHLRRPVPEGQDSMDVMVGEGGVTTAERVQKREDFRALVVDVGDLPETQRTALLLREMDALSYEEIAVAMDTTIPAVKSLLVRARMSLAEATQSRQLTCGEVQLELAEAAEGLRKASGPVRHHIKRCEQCHDFRSQLRSNTKALAALAPIGPLALLYKGLIAKFGWGGSGYRGDRLGCRQRRNRRRWRGCRWRRCCGCRWRRCGRWRRWRNARPRAQDLERAAVGGAGAAGGAGLGSVAAGGLTGAIGAKAAATAATAALLTAGAVEVKQIYSAPRRSGEDHDCLNRDAGSGGRTRCRRRHKDQGRRRGWHRDRYTAGAAPEAPATDAPATPGDPVSEVPDEAPAATTPVTDETADDADGTATPDETYTPATAVVGPAGGGSGSEEEDSALVVEASGSGPAPSTAPPDSGGPTTTPQQPVATPPSPGSTPPESTPGPVTPPVVAPGEAATEPTVTPAE